MPDLGLGGRVSGTATVRGTPAAPDVTFDVSGEGLTAAQVRQAGIEPLAIEARGAFKDNTGTLERAAITNPQGLNATAEGTVPLVGDGLDVRANIANLPLALANTVAPQLGLSGTASGTAEATGSITNPRASFDVFAAGVSANVLEQNGVAPLSIAAQGSFADQTLDLRSATVSNGQGVSVLRVRARTGRWSSGRHLRRHRPPAALARQRRAPRTRCPRPDHRLRAGVGADRHTARELRPARRGRFRRAARAERHRPCLALRRGHVRR